MTFTIFDKCTNSSWQCQYQIQFIYDLNKSLRLQPKSTSISFDLRNSRNQHLTRFAILGKEFEKHSWRSSRSLYLISGVLYRSNKLQDLKYVIVGHNAIK